MTLTVTSIVDEVTDTLRSYVRDQERATTLVADITDAATTLTVSDASEVSRGVIEIGDEAMRVSSVDGTTGTVTVAPWGRGWLGSTAAAHSANTMVRIAPTHPRARIADAVADVVQEIHPDLYGVKEALISPNAAQINYDLPTDVYQVIAAHYNPPGPSLVWEPLRHWRQYRRSGAVEFELLTAVTPGTDRVRLQYIRTPPDTVDLSTDLADYGYLPRIRGVIVLGTVARLVSFLEPARLQAAAPENLARAEAVPSGSATALARYLYQLYRARVADERKALLARFPTQQNWSR